MLEPGTLVISLIVLFSLQAFWYTQTKGVEGPVFGSNNHWNGLGIFFDSFDNDNKHNNPFILAMNNDGTHSYEHQLYASS